MGNLRTSPYVSFIMSLYKEGYLVGVSVVVVFVHSVVVHDNFVFWEFYHYQDNLANYETRLHSVECPFPLSLQSVLD